MKASVLAIGQAASHGQCKMCARVTVHAPVCGVLPTRRHGVERQVCNAHGESCHLHDGTDSVGRAGYQRTARLLSAYSPRSPLFLICATCKEPLKPYGPVGWRWFSLQTPQPDTSRCYETTDTRLVHCVLCMFSSQLLPVPGYTARWQKRMGVNSLPKVVTRQCEAPTMSH